MEQKTESKQLSSTETHIARAKQLRAEVISGFIQDVGQRFNHARSLRKAARQEQLVLSQNAAPTIGRPCF